MQVPSDTPVICPILVGRTADLAALRLLVNRAKGGKGQIALLSGEAGIGKSRLVSEVKTYATAQGFLLFQGNCFQTDLSYPYAPLLDLLRSTAASQFAAAIASDLAPFARELHQLLPDVVSLPPAQAPLPFPDPEREKHRLFAALTHFFMSQASIQPLLLIIEDIHWSDDISLEFLHYLTRRCPAQALLLLLTYRDDEVRPNLRHFVAQLDRQRLTHEFLLACLTREEVEAMLRAIFARPHTARVELLDPIYTLSEGNPFFVEEILKSLITAGDLSYVNGRWERKPLRALHIPRACRTRFINVPLL